MKNNTSIYAWTMLISLIVVVTVTFIICLAEVSKTVSYLLFAVDIAAAIVFTVCPVRITRASAR
ncbi:MAG: hypothetical protein ACLRJC_08165 [Emergencia timonensis]|uniref:hypothetical protein n=2 Tax=Emergencia timonensis TaxID=1776384 RepID=UPI00082F8BD0|nr:hypothetical protein [Emergencia timonensis]WNX89181.1 hypothetical protein RVY71_02670 [Emergencia timonensis]